MNRDLQSLIKRTLREYAETLALALLLALVLRFFVLSAYRISTPSMAPNLKVGDFILGFKLPYGFQIPFIEKKVGQPRARRNDILIFKCPYEKSKSCIKRVVGLAGDRIEIKKKKLILNGRVSEYTKLSDRLQKQSRFDLLPFKGSSIVLLESAGRSKRSILVTDQNLSEAYGPIVVPPDHFFALSDYRDDLEDSRSWGVVPNDLIEARAAFIWFSIDWSPTLSGGGPLIRFERIFKSAK